MPGITEVSPTGARSHPAPWNDKDAEYVVPAEEILEEALSGLQVARGALTWLLKEIGPPQALSNNDTVRRSAVVHADKRVVQALMDVENVLDRLGRNES